MKKIISFLAFVFVFYVSKAQTYVTIPDVNFSAWLNANIPSAMNGNQMDITSVPVTSMKVLDISFQGILDITGIQYFTSLEKLNCRSNSINNLSIVPTSLDSLICGQGSFGTNLSGLPNTLKYLDCSIGGIGYLGTLPSSLEYLDCSNNNINTISVLPSNLKYFYINDNNFLIPNFISGFTLPNNLLSYSCSNSNLTSLQTLPTTLKVLGCNSNQLTSLSALPASLTTLDCRYNQLVNLPSLPNTLIYLDCEGNQLSGLPSLPNSLTYLECRGNQLTSLPSLPPNLDYFVCNGNLISCFPVFPNNNYSVFDISYNPFSCLPNYVQGMSSDDLNYPLCVSGNTITNTNSCITTRGITGYAYLDGNFNCIKNNNEVGVANGVIKLYDNTNAFVASTNIYSNGFYYFNVPFGNYNVKIDTVGYPFTAQCNGIDSLVILSLAQPAADSIDFSVVCKPGFDVGIQSISTFGLPFPGITHTLTVVSGNMINWYNLNCSSGVSGTLSFSVNGPVNFIGPAVGSLTPSVAGNIYTYTISDFGSINNSTDFKLVFQVNTAAQAGDAICVNATVTPISGDHDTQNNNYSYCYNVVNSYDPNKKEVYPEKVQAGFGDWLTYTIHFQNTGNAPAMNIRLEDNLDSKLDPETFQLINYSHNNTIDVTSNHLTIRFPNIQLPDSMSSPNGSIGFIQYRIKPKSGWVTDTIKNSVEIYFDYNAPIVTNTAKSYFFTSTDVEDRDYYKDNVLINPNPSNGLIFIKSPYVYEKIELLSITGQVLLSETVNDKIHELQLQNLAEGIYFVKVIYANGMSATKKVIVNR